MTDLYGVIAQPQTLAGTIKDEDMDVSVTITGESIPGAPTYIHHQQVAAREWLIEHGLGKYPSVTIVDSGGNYVIGDVRYMGDNVLRVAFSAAFAGKAYLN